jgi:hypothetical protein
MGLPGEAAGTVASQGLWQFWHTNRPLDEMIPEGPLVLAWHSISISAADRLLA